MKEDIFSIDIPEIEIAEIPCGHDFTTRFDPEDKANWCKFGSEIGEKDFVSKYCENGPKFPFVLNPNKKNNPMLRDLVCTRPNRSNLLADVKKQETPFYVSMSKFKVHPQFEFTSNLADYYYYALDFEKNKLDTVLFYWIQRSENSTQYNKTIYAMEGIWVGQRKNVIKHYRALHVSKIREDLDWDDKNKRVNLILDVRDYRQLYLDVPEENREIINGIKESKMAEPKMMSERIKEIEDMKKRVPKEAHMLDWLKTEVEKL